MAGLVPAIHVFLPQFDRKAWMPGTRPGMTENERTTHAFVIYFQRAAAHAASDRREPRHRPCHRDPLLLGRLARHHLLTARLSRSLPVGRRTRGSHRGRPWRP